MPGDRAGTGRRPASAGAWPADRPCVALAVAGVAGAAAAAAARPHEARAAAAQDRSPFVLVAGLLLIDIVAGDDGLFAAAGSRLARLTRRGGGPLLFASAALLTGVVTAVLNLDTSVAFLTRCSCTARPGARVREFRVPRWRRVVV